MQEPTVTDHKVLLIGSGAFAVPAFAAVRSAPSCDVVAVVTAAPRGAGRDGALRSTPVAEWARREGLSLLEIGSLRDASTCAQVANLGATIGLLADFGQIVPRALIDAFPGGILNLHPSLLPRHRGASPVPAAILAGDRETGVSTIVMDAGLDTGPLLNVQHSALRGDETSPELEARLADMAGADIVTTLRRYLDGEIRPRPQSTDGVSLTRRLTRHDGFVHSGMGVEQAHRAWRAYRPWPGAWVSVPSMLDRLILDEVGAPIYDRATEPDRFDLLDGILVLGLRGGALPLLHVTPAGGRRMDGAALVRGRPELLSSRARIG